MAYLEFLRNLYEVKRDHETGATGLAVELQIGIQLEVHHSIREVRIDVPGINGSSAKMRGKR